MSAIRSKPRLVILSRFPVAGRVKTRLIPALGCEGALRLHRRLLLRTLRLARAAAAVHGLDVALRVDDGCEQAARFWLGEEFSIIGQGEGDLGRRMGRAVAESAASGAPATILIGTDCPGLSVETIGAALDALQTAPVVFGPALDGGYYLLGLRQSVPVLFAGIDWGTSRVLAESESVVQRAGLTSKRLEPLPDIDRPADLAEWHRLEEVERQADGGVTVVIPALNEAAHVAGAVEDALAGGAREAIVVDGGSTDRTREAAAGAGAVVLTTAPGRARQMNAGAARAQGDVLLFLHADTHLPAGWRGRVIEALRRPGVAAGAFGFAIDDAFFGRRWVEACTRWRSLRFQMPYGDQGLFVTRTRFEELGGYADLPILEDYELVRRLRAEGRIVTLDACALTSGRRWRQLGVVRTTLTNGLIIAGYHAGVPPQRLAQWYRGGGARMGR